MSLYFFDVEDGNSIRDHQGQEFADLDQAQAEAVRRAVAYGGNLNNSEESGTIVVKVRDSMRTDILTVRLVCQVEVH